MNVKDRRQSDHTIEKCIQIDVIAHAAKEIPSKNAQRKCLKQKLGGLFQARYVTAK